MSRAAVKPYLISSDEIGVFHVDIRTTRFNSQGYPLVSSERLGADFKTVAQARSFLRAEFQATAVDIATA